MPYLAFAFTGSEHSYNEEGLSSMAWLKLPPSHASPKVVMTISNPRLKDRPMDCDAAASWTNAQNTVLGSLTECPASNISVEWIFRLFRGRVTRVFALQGGNPGLYFALFLTGGIYVHTRARTRDAWQGLHCPAAAFLVTLLPKQERFGATQRDWCSVSAVVSQGRISGCRSFGFWHQRGEGVK